MYRGQPAISRKGRPLATRTADAPRATHAHNAIVDAHWHQYHIQHMPACINQKQTSSGDNWQDARGHWLPVELLTAYMQGYILCPGTQIGDNTCNIICNSATNTITISPYYITYVVAVHTLLCTTCCHLLCNRSRDRPHAVDLCWFVIHECLSSFCTIYMNRSWELTIKACYMVSEVGWTNFSTHRHSPFKGTYRKLAQRETAFRTVHDQLRQQFRKRWNEIGHSTSCGWPRSARGLQRLHLGRRWRCQKGRQDILKFRSLLYPAQNVTWNRHVFTPRTQLPGETINRYVADLHSKAESCEFGTLPKSLIRDHIICRVLSDDTRKKSLATGEVNTSDIYVEFWATTLRRNLWPPVK